MKNIFNKIKGAYIGCALGDAMGMPTENLSSQKIKDNFGLIEGFVNPLEGVSLQSKKMKAGMITDDTHQALFLTDLIVNNKGFLNARQYLDALINWLNTTDIAKDVTGPSTKAALAKYAQGIPITQIGRAGITNGAAMKIFPIGIISSYDNLDKLIDNVYEICYPTHNTKIAIRGSVIIAAIISYSLNKKFSLDKMWELAITLSEMNINKGYDFPTTSLTYWLNYTKYICETKSHVAALEELYNVIGTTFETVKTVPAALAFVHLSNADPLICAKLSASIGGDTDTIGAIACSICGTVYPDIPDNLVERLEKVNHISFDNITNSIYPYFNFYT